MNLTDLLNEITDFAKLPSFTPQMVAQAVGIDFNEFQLALENPESDIAMAFNRGKLLAKAELDKKIAQLSQQGSGPAQSLQISLIRQSEYYRLLEHYGK